MIQTNKFYSYQDMQNHIKWIWRWIHVHVPSTKNQRRKLL